jgi:hypothetical protein
MVTNANLVGDRRSSSRWRGVGLGSQQLQWKPSVQRKEVVPGLHLVHGMGTNSVPGRDLQLSTQTISRSHSACQSVEDSQPKEEVEC